MASNAIIPNYVFPALTVGQRRNYPQEFYQNTWSARYDLNWTVNTHDMKVGAEYLRWHDTGQWQLLSRGEFVFTRNPTDLERRFPADAWDDPTRWDVTGLDGFVQRYDLNFGDWTIDIPRPTVALWFGDTWRMNNQLTVNYGIRWDADWGALDPPDVTSPITFNPRGGNQYADIDLTPGEKLYPGGLQDINNIADVLSQVALEPDWSNNHAEVMHEITDVADLECAEQSQPDDRLYDYPLCKTRISAQQLFHRKNIPCRSGLDGSGLVNGPGRSQ